MLRRALALGGGLILLILIVLGVRGCLNARKDRALTDYADKVTEIVSETKQRSQSFFAKLSNPGTLSVTEFVTEVEADSSAMDNYRERVDALDAPGDMGKAQKGLELVYELRASAMARIADRMSTALGNVGAEKATATIANQMRTLIASDVVYAEVVRPEINGVLANNGIEGHDVPKSVFVPEDRWLEESAIATALGSVTGATGTATPGVHGLGLIATSVSGTELVSDSVTSVSAEETPEVEVQVQNQGESTENRITVSVTVSGGDTLQETIESIEAGETETVTIPLTPAPKGRVTLEVNVQPVPGERVADNNKASYTVNFQ